MFRPLGIESALKVNPDWPDSFYLKSPGFTADAMKTVQPAPENPSYRFWTGILGRYPTIEVMYTHDRLASFEHQITTLLRATLELMKQTGDDLLLLEHMDTLVLRRIG